MFAKQLLLKNCAVDFVEICNVCTGKAIIKSVKRISNSGKICHSFCDFYFGVTFLEHSVVQVLGNKCFWLHVIIPSSRTNKQLFTMQASLRHCFSMSHVLQLLLVSKVFLVDGKRAEWDMTVTRPSITIASSSDIPAEKCNSYTLPALQTFPGKSLSRKDISRKKTLCLNFSW